MGPLLLTWMLRLMLWLLMRASRTDPAYRAALSRDLRVELTTGDGVSMCFVVRDRRFGRDDAGHGADLSLHFRNSLDALAFLISRDPLSRMIDAETASSIIVNGNVMLLLWFQGRIQQAVPFARGRRRKITLPGSVTAPIIASGTRRQIERLPAVAELDPDWPGAHRARDQIYMVRVAQGDRTVPY